MSFDKEKKPPKYAFVKKALLVLSKALVVLGILFPVLLFAPLLFTHGAVDTLKFDGPTQHLFVAIFGVVVITLLAAVINSHYSGHKFLHSFTIVIAVASIIISLIFASFVYVPQFSRYWRRSAPAYSHWVKRKRAGSGIGFLYRKTNR